MQVHALLRQRRLRLLGHVYGMEDGRIQKIFFMESWLLGGEPKAAHSYATRTRPQGRDPKATHSCATRARPQGREPKAAHSCATGARSKGRPQLRYMGEIQRPPTAALHGRDPKAAPTAGLQGRDPKAAHTCATGARSKGRPQLCCKRDM